MDRESPSVSQQRCGSTATVAFISSFVVAPPDRFSRSRTFSVLRPWRVPAAFAHVAFLGALAPFLAGVAFLPRLGFRGRDVRLPWRNVGLTGGLRLRASS